MIKIDQLIKISLFLVLLTSLMIGCFKLFDTTVSNSYQNYEEAVADGIIERGWIPDFLPVSAVNIFEKHDLDTNEIILKFDVGATELTNIISRCQIVDTFPTPKILTANWWSNDLISSVDNHFYCDDDKAYLAVDNNKKTVYYWRTY